MVRIPFLVGVVPLFILHYLGLFSWWWLMLDLFGRDMTTEGIGTAYLMPTAFALAGYPEEQRRAHLKPMFEGLMALNQEKRDIVMKTQREAMTALSEEEHSKTMRTMNEFMFSSVK